MRDQQDQSSDGRLRRSGGGIAVTGSGAISVEPDIASVSVTINQRHEQLATARALVAEKAAAARDHLLAAGIEGSDLETTRLNVHTVRHHRDNYRPGEPGAVFTEYDVSTTLHAVFRQDLELAQVVVNELFDRVGEGLELHNLRFDRADRSEAQLQARALAFADARAKAEQLADLAGARLGVVRSVREDDADHPQPRGVRRMAAMAESVIPIESGSLVESVVVRVRWSIEAD